jgi:hypothetical protein
MTDPIGAACGTACSTFGRWSMIQQFKRCGIRAGAAQRMKRYLIFLIAWPLAGCDVNSTNADQKNATQKQVQLARCVYEAETSYSSATWLPGDARQSYVWLCMAAQGYALNRGRTCEAKATPAADAALYAQCYEPNSKSFSQFSKLK